MATLENNLASCVFSFILMAGFWFCNAANLVCKERRVERISYWANNRITFFHLLPQMDIGGVVFQRPDVKSGNSTGMPIFTDSNESGIIALHVAAS